MAEEIDLRFLGEQIKRLQGDVRQVKSDMAQMRTDVGGDLVVLRADMVAVKVEQSRADGRLEAFRETVDDRFEQQIELIKSSFRSLSQEIATFRVSVDDRFASVDGRLASVDDRLASVDGRFESIDGRFESIDGRFEQQLELIKSGFKTLSQEIATLKKS
jgi:archaellum component FlaC